MTNERGVNVLAKAERGKWKAGSDENMGFGIWEMGGFRYPISNILYPGRRLLAWSVAVLLAMVSVAAAQEGGWKEDLKRMGFEVPVEELEKGEIVGQKWLVEKVPPGFLGARVFFISPVDAQKTSKTILEFDPTGKKQVSWSEEGSVKIYQSFPWPLDPKSWDRFRSALAQPPFDLLLQVAGKKEGKIHLTPEEITKISSAKTDGWIEILEKRIQMFRNGGWKGNLAVPSGPENQQTDFDDDLLRLLAMDNQKPVLDEFQGILRSIGSAGKLGQNLEVQDYWQLMEVDKSPAVVLGFGVMRKSESGRYEVADMHYYVSNGYFGAISLYAVWPLENGKSMVCRIDAVETDPGELSQSTARMFGEGIFMREVKAGCKMILDQLRGS